MKARTYWALWFLQILAVLILIFVLSVPIQDYAMREFKEYERIPSERTLQAFRDKKQAELRLRHEIAVPVAGIVVLLAILTFRKHGRAASQQP